MDKKERQFLLDALRVFAKNLDKHFLSIHNQLKLLMTRQSDFDATLAKLKPAIDQVQSDFGAYKAAAQAQGVDLTAEEATLQASLDELTAIHAEAGLTQSTPAPAPASPATGS